jgi:hypothetical protein
VLLARAAAKRLRGQQPQRPDEVSRLRGELAEELDRVAERERGERGGEG